MLNLGKIDGNKIPFALLYPVQVRRLDGQDLQQQQQQFPLGQLCDYCILKNLQVAE
jgi:hypothetical protein